VDIIYLDYNCFQRGFDDPRQVKIQMEALACEAVFLRAEKREIKLVWSFMHEDENIFCPFMERKLEVAKLSVLCKIKVEAHEEIIRLAKDFQEKVRLSSKDAVHLACAYYARSRFFLTCDDDLIKRAQRLNLAMNIMNPVEYIRRERR
jgi:predicted nucleic acid-binding protein